MDANINKKELQGDDFVRLVNNFYNASNVPATYDRIGIDSQLFNYVAHHMGDTEKKYKVAFTFICLNPLYWEYAKRMVDSARSLFLPGHDTDFLFWTDIPDNADAISHKMAEAYGQVCAQRNIPPTEKWVNEKLNVDIQNVVSLQKEKNIIFFPTEPIEWPYPTLLRYNLFLQQEELLKGYDYIFYCDIDMQFVNVVGDEILGNDLTAAVHPMYYVRKELNPPYEPNKDSTAYIHRSGRIINDTGNPRFQPLYFAGGIQGGKSNKFIEAMKKMRENIDKDLTNNYIAIWNDESHWNRYLFENPPSVILTPAYVYPDSLIEEYYVKLWGCNYTPKLMTLTKWFSISQQGGDHVQQIVKQL